MILLLLNSITKLDLILVSAEEKVLRQSLLRNNLIFLNNLKENTNYHINYCYIFQVLAMNLYSVEGSDRLLRPEVYAKYFPGESFVDYSLDFQDDEADLQLEDLMRQDDE